MENSILKLLGERDNMPKEISKENNNNELDFLKNRIVEHEKELNYLKQEISNMNNSYEPEDNYIKPNIIQGQKYIFEIYLEFNKIFTGGEDTIKNMETVSRETINYLHKLEDKLLFYINEMETIQGNGKEPDEIFKNALENVKNENRYKKVQASRLLLQKLEEEKLLKYQKRMNRIKIRNVVEYPPPWVQKKKKRRK